MYVCVGCALLSLSASRILVFIQNSGATTSYITETKTALKRSFSNLDTDLPQDVMTSFRFCNGQKLDDDDVITHEGLFGGFSFYDFHTNVSLGVFLMFFNCSIVSLRFLCCVFFSALAFTVP
jgi:hypothetical protein